MAHEMDEQEQAWLTEVRVALQGVTEPDSLTDRLTSIKAETVHTFGGKVGIQLYRQAAWHVGRGNPWRKVGPMIFPPEGKGWAETLRILADLAEGAEPGSPRQ